MDENQDHFMIRLMRRCEADLWYSIPMLICTLCLFLLVFAPEPWQTWVVIIAGAAFVIALIAVCRNIGKERAGKELPKRRYPMIGWLDNVLLVAIPVLGFLVILYYTWIAPLIK